MKNPLQHTNEYITYVQDLLGSIPEDQIIKACYQTETQLSLTRVDLGETPKATDIWMNCVATIDPPDLKEYDEWKKEFNQAKELVRSWLKRRSK